VPFEFEKRWACQAHLRHGRRAHSIWSMPSGPLARGHAKNVTDTCSLRCVVVQHLLTANARRSGAGDSAA
jgi:hypothetical protein